LRLRIIASAGSAGPDEAADSVRAKPERAGRPVLMAVPAARLRTKFRRVIVMGSSLCVLLIAEKYVERQPSGYYGTGDELRRDE
jgi:hypothetical protein